MGVLTAASGLRLRIGSGLSIVGYNDIPLVSRLPVALSSVRTSFEQIASTALELLLSPEEGDRGIRVALPTLIPRASTAPPGR